ncbi:hypothetical protein EPA93_17690 [Ktedonosporobacter rubrisoli]|uniref:Photosynthesis system II assembly factor Ycf48/Hcf136-like domain-containing protein n=1 Tax=Ktedonosporobacter rubrisoli TaxID=2509675 RepID=A0A4P6JQY7_KTERU|nr:hypothetical protein [Ktedonosporobacter rubrisoli]QBD77724.1 hypothetical protein EPA93_17690 [Ktedonosporobacter rubrisoli]
MLTILLCLLLTTLSSCGPSTGIFATGNWQDSGLHQHIRALAVDPNNPGTLYAADTQGHIFYSTDAAQHWNERSTGLSLPNPVHALALDIPGKKLYAATAQGLFVSTDAAQHWNSVLTPTAGLPPDSYTALAFNGNAPDIFYTATAGHGIFISTNGGSSWTSASNGLPQGSAITSLSFAPDTNQLWAATSSHIYQADSKATSWQAADTGLPADISINTVHPASESGGPHGFIYAGTNRGFYLSRDSGKHWSRGQVPLSGTSIHCMLVDFRNTQTTAIYVGTDVGVLASDDNGQNWRNIGSGFPKGQPVYALVLGAESYSQLFAATDNSVYMFPGTNTGFGLTRIITIAAIIVFFYLLYRVADLSRKRRRKNKQAEQTEQAPSEPLPPAPKD